MASTSWPLRIRPVPVMPISWAIRCRSANFMPDSPEPPRRVGLSVTVSPAGVAAPDGPLSGPDWDASEVPEEPVKSSVVSLTRGPSQGAGSGRACGRSTRCHDPANRPGQGTAVLLRPYSRGAGCRLFLVLPPCLPGGRLPGRWLRPAISGLTRIPWPGQGFRNEPRRLGLPALALRPLPVHHNRPVFVVRGGEGVAQKVDGASLTPPGRKAGQAASDGRAPDPLAGYLVQCLP